MKAWLIARLRERSTWLGLIGFLTAAGITLSPEQTQAIAAAGVAVAGLFSTIWPDVKP